MEKQTKRKENEKTLRDHILCVCFLLIIIIIMNIIILPYNLL